MGCDGPARSGAFLAGVQDGHVAVGVHGEPTGVHRVAAAESSDRALSSPGGAEDGVAAGRPHIRICGAVGPNDSRRAVGPRGAPEGRGRSALADLVDGGIRAFCWRSARRPEQEAALHHPDQGNEERGVTSRPHIRVCSAGCRSSPAGPSGRPGCRAVTAGQQGKAPCRFNQPEDDGQAASARTLEDDSADSVAGGTWPLASPALIAPTMHRARCPRSAS